MTIGTMAEQEVTSECSVSDLCALSSNRIFTDDDDVNSCSTSPRNIVLSSHWHYQNKFIKLFAKNQTMGDTLQPRGENYEHEHVHTVYEAISTHFSSTRFKPWPIIERFLKGLTPGSVGLDVGCGNGKYLAVNPNIFMVGSDRCVRRSRPHWNSKLMP